MKKDIPQPKVEELAIAIAPREGEPGIWDSYVINMKENPIQNVLVNSKGYGKLDGVEKETTVLRHFFEEIGPEKSVLIEPMHESILDLTNEFWISFTYDGHMYDKKYVFVKGSIDVEYFTPLPFLETKGVMIR
ncbi:MAG: hypothetical protein GYB31_08480 [Bacteroidetes bacterium]|nr:hypothetical protein [Bacteroidota bacterium]